MTSEWRLQLSKVWIVVPAFGESRTIANVVGSLKALGYPNICVVDDGSHDQTGALALHAGAHVLSHLINLGQGAALQTGITYALANGAEYVCTFDADGQHSPCSVADLLDALDDSHVDVALGSRFLDLPCNVPLTRRLLLKAALLFTRFHARVRVTDTHNGLRAFSRRGASAIRIEQPGMAHASEILQKLGSAKLGYVEVPVDITYTEHSRKKGQSGFDSVKIVLDLLYGSIALRH
jgi:glycosyltransferase involved in cell wall biosynthesis